MFKTGEITLRNPYNNDFQVNNGNIYNRDEDVGYIRFNIIGDAEQFIRIKSCFKLPCSDTSNHIEEIIVSDMISKSNTEAGQVLNKRISASMGEIKSALEKGNKKAA